MTVFAIYRLIVKKLSISGDQLIYMFIFKCLLQSSKRREGSDVRVVLFSGIYDAVTPTPTVSQFVQTNCENFLSLLKK